MKITRAMLCAGLLAGCAMDEADEPEPTEVQDGAEPEAGEFPVQIAEPTDGSLCSLHGQMPDAILELPVGANSRARVHLEHRTLPVTVRNDGAVLRDYLVRTSVTVGVSRKTHEVSVSLAAGQSQTVDVDLAAGGVDLNRMAISGEATVDVLRIDEQGVPLLVATDQVFFHPSGVGLELYTEEQMTTTFGGGDFTGAIADTALRDALAAQSAPLHSFVSFAVTYEPLDLESEEGTVHVE